VVLSDNIGAALIEIFQSVFGPANLVLAAALAARDVPVGRVQISYSRRREALRYSARLQEIYGPINVGDNRNAPDVDDNAL
jgi:hypothetical protein